MSWKVCLEINTGHVMIPVTSLVEVNAALYRELLAAGVDLPSINGDSADSMSQGLTEAMAKCGGRAFRFLSGLREDCNTHTKARVSVRQ